MDRKEFIQRIKDKSKGILLTKPAEQAEMLDMALEIGEGLLQKMKEVEEDKALLADLKTNFPVIYREAKRLFNQPKTTEP